ncbi:SDR family NAD(P)-dependent oxidoreductase [Micromonospora sediminimaris]|uniref:Short-chain dehydrogenase/reductase n=1 Tax=Micromonospora sediminimaris TaxID=547162 RepID=A0A9W5UVI8_9ACTN|nr:SDR family NAD(P)-dependent oxidoreductase [Micromonospora sediminimaris]GIJ35321.1 short-chain dehydrogenase/reductase [Micromonospora sediminimaris]SFC52961.1 NAD(P)-dependent dehydrogenase, short-chain alcohol dehydrogenase family [Micromonospora sediminimaris]
MSVVLVTGAATGIGNLAAAALARAGHTVYATMRDVEGRNADHAATARDRARQERLDLHVIDLDVTSQESANAAVRTVVERHGGLDVVINNAGHLYVGYVEAFTDDDVMHLIDVNAIGAHRVNRAVLPHFRERRAGVLMYVGSTIPVTTPPFLGPYVVSKAAMDALAVVTAYEANAFGIETVIVMPGAITEGTEHFPNASRATDQHVAAAYSALDPLVERNEHATATLLKHPLMGAAGVTEEIVRVLGLPFGAKPFRTVIDDAHAGVERVNDIAFETRAEFVRRLGFAELLAPARF